MSLPSITPSDFTGLVNISADTYQSADLSAAINDLRDQVIRELLGLKAYTDISLNNRASWSALFAGGVWVDDEGDSLQHYPLRTIVIDLIYSRYIVSQSHVNTNVGFVENYNENAESVSGANVGALSVKAQSRAANWYHQTICPFIEEFRKVEEEIISISDLGSSVYEITVANASTYYLESGDTVTINGDTFTAGNVTATTFEVVATAGQAGGFVGANAVWEPFRLVKNPLTPINPTSF